MLLILCALVSRVSVLLREERIHNGCYTFRQACNFKFTWICILLCRYKLCYVYVVNLGYLINIGCRIAQVSVYWCSFTLQQSFLSTFIFITVFKLKYFHYRHDWHAHHTHPHTHMSHPQVLIFEIYQYLKFKNWPSLTCRSPFRKPLLWIIGECVMTLQSQNIQHSEFANIRLNMCVCGSVDWDCCV